MKKGRRVGWCANHYDAAYSVQTFFSTFLFCLYVPYSHVIFTLLCFFLWLPWLHLQHFGLFGILVHYFVWLALLYNWAFTVFFTRHRRLEVLNVNTSTPRRLLYYLLLLFTPTQRLSRLQSNNFNSELFPMVHLGSKSKENFLTHPWINPPFTCAHLGTLRYLNLFTCGSNSLLTQREQSTIFQQRTKAKSWRCWLSSQSLHTRLQTTPVHSEGSLIRLPEAHHVQRAKQCWGPQIRHSPPPRLGLQNLYPVTTLT